MSDSQPDSQPGSQSGSAAGSIEAGFGEPAGDIADQADRLTRLMEIADRGRRTHPPAEPSPLERYPLQDSEEVLAQEDAMDGSDDPMHAGGLTPARWIAAEEAAMHVVDDAGTATGAWLCDQTDAERADPFRDQFDGPTAELTPEDQTILGIDPYE